MCGEWVGRGRLSQILRQTHTHTHTHIHTHTHTHTHTRNLPRVGNHIFVSTYFQVSDTPAHGHNLWHGQWLCPWQGESTNPEPILYWVYVKLPFDNAGNLLLYIIGPSPKWIYMIRRWYRMTLKNDTSRTLRGVGGGRGVYYKINPRKFVPKKT